MKVHLFLEFSILGGGSGTIGETELTAIQSVEVNSDITFQASSYSNSILMEIEI